jgi:hypothetical protein
MKKQLLDLLKRGEVDLWIDEAAPASERFVVQTWTDPEASNYYGRTLSQAVDRAWEEEVKGLDK